MWVLRVFEKICVLTANLAACGTAGPLDNGLGVGRKGTGREEGPKVNNSEEDLLIITCLVVIYG